MLSQTHIHRLYAQGSDAIVRVVRRLESQIEDTAAQLIRSPQPVIALLTKELQQAKRTLLRQTDELRRGRQLNHQLIRRIRELELEVERDSTPVSRDSHNSSLPPSLDPPWQKIPRTRSLRQQTGKGVGGQLGHTGATLRQVQHPDKIILACCCSVVRDYSSNQISQHLNTQFQRSSV